MTFTDISFPLSESACRHLRKLARPCREETGRFESAEEAIKFGNERRAEKVCVIVRPDYNEGVRRLHSFKQ